MGGERGGGSGAIVIDGVAGVEKNEEEEKLHGY